MVWAAATISRFSLCGVGGVPVWYGPFHPHLVIDSEAIAMELTAWQALWLAGCARERSCVTAATVRLILARSATVTAPILDWAAIGSGLTVDVGVNAVNNPALGYCHSDGQTHWRNSDLTTLIEYPGQTR
ncbi:hypothetical protein K7711_36540 [Nocardia sp. CA2R105]|uniref:hypothetical protein n=1 Tax=Nocardia coffeae TaxID=2873381 RepID=UPI001CA6019F|nr:hypothetical protein [Nocardia coffeae]MBY8862033.1 hypothetical protein [Nocardia coffeae]